MGLDVVIISHFTILSTEKGNCRFRYLADMICNENTKVELITSDYSHELKRHRDKNVLYKEQQQFTLTMLHESGYPKNVCIKRLGSHKKFAKNLRDYLKKRKVPDILYCAVPSLDAAFVAAKYCKKNKVRFIIDVQDLWPEAFQMVFDIPIVSNIIFAPMKRKADKIYSFADRIIAVSKTYADRALRVNKKTKNADVVYLGTDKEFFDSCASADEARAENVKKLFESKGNKIWLAYAGTLGSSYDLPVVFDAMRMLNKEVLDNITMIVMGDGPRRAEFEEKAKGLPIVFIGSLPYPDMVWLLSRCDIALNPIRKGAAQSIINKHMDYAMAGLPIINTQECAEYRHLLEEYDCGINCGCGDSADVKPAIETIAGDMDMRERMGRNSRRLGEELFDRATAYRSIVQIIEDIEKDA